MGNSPPSGQGASEPHERDVQGVESTDGRPNKLAEEIRDNPSNPTPSHYRKANRAMRPIYGCPEKFRESLGTPTATLFPKLLMGFCCNRSYESARKMLSS